MDKMACGECRRDTPHISRVAYQIVTKWRTVTRTVHRCEECKSVHSTETEVKNENVQILDG